MNQTLKFQLQKLVNDQMDDWDQLIDNVLFAYSSSRHDSIYKVYAIPADVRSRGTSAH